MRRNKRYEVLEGEMFVQKKSREEELVQCVESVEKKRENGVHYGSDWCSEPWSLESCWDAKKQCCNFVIMYN